VDVYVELRDEFSRTLQRGRTNSAGHFSFNGLASGRFKVAVLPYELPYEEQEHDVEIVNFNRPATGGSFPTGFSNEFVDVYLKLKKGAALGTNAVVFAQEVPPAAKALYENAVADLDAHRQEAAYQKLKDALEIFPKYYLALDRLGTEYVQKGYFEAAAILLNLAVSVNPRSYSGWYGLGYSRYSLKDLGGAKLAIAKAVELAPQSATALLLYGSILRQNGESSDAEARLLKVKEISKDTMPQVHWELALLYGNQMKRYADAAKELRTFLRMEPDAKDSENINKLIADFEAKARHS
jgi:tetratricopeptide (TPR) repeat protein